MCLNDQPREKFRGQTFSIFGVSLNSKEERNIIWLLSFRPGRIFKEFSNYIVLNILRVIILLLLLFFEMISYKQIFRSFPCEK